MKVSQETLNLLEMARREGRVTGTEEPIPGAALPIEPIVKPISEKSFMWAIINLAEGFGWGWYHTYDSRRSNPGYPDLHLWRQRMIWIETKTEKGTLTADQVRVHGDLRSAGAELHVFRPSDWEKIVDLLR